MKLFIRKALIYLGVMFIILMSIELVLLTKSNDFSYKHQYLKKHHNDIKTLILGHSHFEMGLNPAYMAKGTFNTAISGRNCYYDMRLAEDFIPQMNNLKCVILPYGYGLEYNSMRYSVARKASPGKKARFQQDLSGTYRCMYYKYMGYSFKPTDFIYWSEILNSKLDFWNRLFCSSDIKMNQCDSLGYVKMDIASRSASWKEERLPSEVYYESESAKKALDEFIECYTMITKLCHDKNIRLIVLSTPVCETYQKCETERGLKNISVIISKLKKVYPSIEYYNFMFDKRFGEDDFFDASHLSEIGAEKFSRIVQKEVLDNVYKTNAKLGLQRSKKQ